MKASSSSPVTPCGFDAQSRQRYGASTAARNFRLASAASSSRCTSRSSRNLRNMIHVRSGNRSRSPFRPLSLRMMSRADLSRLPSDCGVVGAGPFPPRALRGIKLGLQLAHGVAEPVCTAEEVDDVRHGAVVGERRYVQDVRKNELRVAVLRVFVEQLLEDLSGFGSEAVEEILSGLAKTLRAFAARTQRSVEREVTEQIEGIGVGLLGGFGQLVEVDPA